MYLNMNDIGETEEFIDLQVSFFRPELWQRVNRIHGVAIGPIHSQYDQGCYPLTG